jgi:hypothetical protein
MCVRVIEDDLLELYVFSSFKFLISFLVCKREEMSQMWECLRKALQIRRILDG